MIAGIRRTIWAPAVIAVILMGHTGLLGWSAYRHSPVWNEVGHLPAGISHWRLGRFDLYRVNPPLVRMVAALPVLAAEPATDWSHYSLAPMARDETAVGWDFIQANGPRLFWLYTLGRWACIPFSWVGAWVCYRWARDLYGLPSGLVAMALWCFCPNILGHGSLMMPDVPSAALGAAACYAFWRWLRTPTWARALSAGVVLGLAELTKTTLVVFYPLWPLLWLLNRLPDRHRMATRRWLRELAMLGTQLAVGLYVINFGYGFEGSLQRLGDYRFESRLLSGVAPTGMDRPLGNRFARTPLASVPVPLPRNYVQGIDAQKDDFERGLRSYLRGRWCQRGWWYFYLYGLMVKVPLGTWTLGAVAAALTLASRGGAARRRDEMVVLVPLAAVLSLVSSQTGFSIHFRYVLPVLPLVFVWASKAVSAFDPEGTGGVDGVDADLPRRSLRTSLMPWIAIAALAWSVGESLRYYPHSLSYFNELAGGPGRGHEHLLDSSISWGQDLLYLKDWYDARPDARPLHVAAFGLVDPARAGIGFHLPPLGPDRPGAAASEDPGELGPRPGWYAIDINFLEGSDRGMPDGRGSLARTSRDGLGLRYFRTFRPAARIAYSMYVYHITAEQAARVRGVLGIADADGRR